MQAIVQANRMSVLESPILTLHPANDTTGRLVTPNHYTQPQCMSKVSMLSYQAVMIKLDLPLIICVYTNYQSGVTTEMRCNETV